MTAVKRIRHAWNINVNIIVIKVGIDTASERYLVIKIIL